MTRPRQGKRESSVADGMLVPLLREGSAAVEAVDSISVILFDIGGKLAAISVEDTEGVVECPRITPLPNAPDGVEGITSIRGRMTIVVNAGPDGPLSGAKRRLILTKGETQAGLLADRVEGVLAVSASEIRPLGSRRTGRGVSRDRIVLTQTRARAVRTSRRFFQRNGVDIPILELKLLFD